MLQNLSTLRSIVETFGWFATLGASELKYVRDETAELIQELSASLVSLWDIASTLSNVKPDQLQRDEFEKLYQYFYKFYLGPQNLSAARTHCGNVERSVGRIKYKLAHLLHTDLGKWAEADSHLAAITTADPVILNDYDQTIRDLHGRLRVVRGAFETGDDQGARVLYADLVRSLEPDIEHMREGVAKMNASLDHVRRLSG